MKLIVFKVVALASLLIAGPVLAAEPPQLVIGHVNGQPVSGDEFTPYLRAYLRSKLFHAGSPERTRALADEAIDAFLVDRVLNEQAAAQGLKADEAEVERRISDIKTRFGGRADWPEIASRLPKLREEIEVDLRIEALKLKISKVEPPNEADVRSYYDRHVDTFTRPAGYKLKLLLIAVEPGASVDTWRAAEVQAQDYARKVAAGEDFAALARAHSKHGSAEQGGAMGLVHEGQLGEAAEAALRSAKPGEVAGPVRLLEGVALFQVEEKRRPELMSFAEVKDRAATLVERDRSKRQWSAFVETIREKFSIDRSAFAEFLAGALR